MISFTQPKIRKIKLILNYIIFGIIINKLNYKYGVNICMEFMEYRLSKFKNDIANVFYNNVLIRIFYYLLEKRINTRILFLMTTYRRVLAHTNQLELGKRRWNLEDLFSGSWISASIPTQFQSSNHYTTST